jgi:WD40 repeat protein
MRSAAADAVRKAAWVVAVTLALIVGTRVAGLGVRETSTRAAPAAGRDESGDPLPPWAICRVGSARFRGAVDAVGFTDAGRGIVHCTADGCVRTIDRATGATVREFVAHRGLVDPPPPTSLWEKVGSELDVVHEHRWRDGIRGAAISADGSRVFTSGAASADVWDVATGRMVARWPTRDFVPVAFSRDGARVATGGFYADVWVHDAATGAELLALPGDQPAGGWGGENSVALSPDGSLVAVQTYRLRVVDVAARMDVFSTPRDDFAGPVAFSPDGAFLLHVRKNEAVVVRDAKTWAAVRELPFRAQAIAFSPDGRVVAIADDAVRIVEFATGAVLRTFDGQANRLAFSPDGRTAAALSSTDQRVRVFDVANGVEDPPRRPPFSWSAYAEWSSDGRRLVVPDGGVLRIADATTGRFERTIETGGDIVRLDPVDARRAVAMGGFRAMPTAWIATFDVESGAESSRSPFHPPVWYGFWDAAAGAVRMYDFADHALRMLDPRSGAVIRRFDCPGVENASVDVREGLFATHGPTPREFHVRDLETGADVAEIVAPASMESPSLDGFDRGRLLVQDDGRLALYDARTGRRLVVVRCEALSARRRAAVSPDARLLAATDADHAVRLFDGATGAELAALRGHRDVVMSIEFSPDGRRLATSSSDGTILVWDVAGATGR